MLRVFGVVLILTLVWLVSSGQRQPIQPYGHYSPRQVKIFANGDSPKAIQFKEALFLKTGETSLDPLFDKVVLRDTTLLEGKYDNSCWDVPTQKIKYFTGKLFTGKVYIYRNEVFETVLYKDTCLNILNTPKKYFGLIDEDQPNKVVKVDSLGGGTTIINNTTVVNYYGEKDTTLNKSLENLRGQKDSVKWYETTVAGIVGGLIIGGVSSYFIFKKEKTPPPKPYIPPITPVIPPVVEPRTMPDDGIPAEPRTMPDDGIPAEPTTQPDGILEVETPETPTPETPIVTTPGLPADTRGMPGGISSKIVSVSVVLPAPWTWGR